MARLALALLGSPQVTLDGAPVRFDTRKAVALLAYLACTGRPHSRDTLAALLWPEYADARNALRRTLSTLQRTIGEGWLDVGPPVVAPPAPWRPVAAPPAPWRPAPPSPPARPVAHGTTVAAHGRLAAHNDVELPLPVP